MRDGAEALVAQALLDFGGKGLQDGGDLLLGQLGRGGDIGHQLVLGEGFLGGGSSFCHGSFFSLRVDRKLPVVRRTRGKRDQTPRREVAGGFTTTALPLRFRAQV